MTRKRRRPGHKIKNVDRKVLRYCTRVPTSAAANRVLSALGSSADHSALWMGLACVLAMRRGRPRRAAVREVSSIALTSLIINAAAKRVRRRRRPAPDLLRWRHRPARPPRSPSFPSGHAASAAAAVTALWMEHHRLGLAAAPVAAAVAYSRLHTGVHWPSDVIGGCALGMATASSTRYLWPPSR